MVLVEREPMWDGNTFTNKETFTPETVEREPMWDGNESKEIHSPLYTR